ncbi:MAG: GNAT family N-acetyltransferase [Beijerinckiaceae bacterium]
MTAQPALRPYLPSDLPVLIEIFRDSIAELTGDDYSSAQQDAWIAVADDAAAFGKRLAAQLTLVLTLEGRIVAFASLKDGTIIDMLYVAPFCARRGFATHLVDALERLASARGAKALTVEASDTAQDFFTQRGYIMQQRNSVALNDEWLANTTMQKPLDAAQMKSH